MVRILVGDDLGEASRPSPAAFGRAAGIAQFVEFQACGFLDADLDLGRISAGWSKGAGTTSTWGNRRLISQVSGVPQATLKPYRTIPTNLEALRFAARIQTGHRRDQRGDRGRQASTGT